MQENTNFKIYNASAGSGKTFTLAVNYLSILLQSKTNFAYQHILAITFTNKAVGEMKSRIMEHLIGFSKDEIHESYFPILHAIEAKTGLSAIEIQQKSKEILPFLLNNYAGVEISTIDSFTHRLIRTFAKDLGLTTNFSIELESQEVVDKSVHELIDKVGQDELLTKILIDFALEKTNDDKSGDISLDLLEVAKLLNNENHLPYIELLSELSLGDFKKIKKENFAFITSHETNIKTIASQILDTFHVQQIEESHFSRGSVFKFFKKALELELPPKWDATWQMNISSNALYPAKTPTDIKQLIDDLQPTIALAFQQIKEASFALRYHQQIGKYLTQTSVLWLIKQTLDELKKEDNILFINDFNKKISEEIRQQPAPFIYERMGEKFYHYFIDEFQDTSQMQWKNLIPLIENALVGMQKNEAQGELNLVGDAKQSIYAWRGGDAQQFIDLYEGNSPFPVDASSIPLQTNYRSQEKIVEFNNDFFGFVADKLDNPSHQNLYHQAKQDVRKKEGKGFVQIDFSEINNTEEANEIYPQKVASIIKHKIASKEATYKDFCVLVRNTKHGVEVAKYLTSVEIPIISSETLLIQNSPKVQWILALMNAFNTDAKEAWYEVFLLLLQQKEYSAEEKHRLLAKALQLSPIKALEYLGISLDGTKFMSYPLYDALIYLQKQTSFLQEEESYVQFFLEEVFRFSKKKSSDLGAFLNYWESVKDKRSIVAPEGQNAVQILTIHKSKGLQFPIVIFPYADFTVGSLAQDMLWLPTPFSELNYALVSGQSNFYTELDEEVASVYQTSKDKKILEDINILYVALTRAENEMYLLGKYKTTAKGISFGSDNCSAFLADFLAHSDKWEEGKFLYTFGSPMQLSASKVSKENQFIEQLSMREESALDMLSHRSFLWTQGRIDAIERGNLIHQLLAELKDNTQIEAVIKKSLNKGEINKTEAAELKQTLEEICFHTKLKTYYKEGVEAWNEKELLHQGNLFRPDRVVFEGKKAIIIDYKTGESSEAFIAQVNQYAEAVEALGFSIQKKIIVYIGLFGGIEVVEV